MTYLRVQARSASAQASPPSPQVKAAVIRVWADEAESIALQPNRLDPVAGCYSVSGCTTGGYLRKTLNATAEKPILGQRTSSKATLAQEGAIIVEGEARFS